MCADSGAMRRPPMRWRTGSAFTSTRRPEPNRRLRAKAVRPFPKLDWPRRRDPPQPARWLPPLIAAMRSTSATSPRALRPCALLRLALPGRTRNSRSSLMAGPFSAENRQ